MGTGFSQFRGAKTIDLNKKKEPEGSFLWE
jgi:hypothetical protein